MQQKKRQYTKPIIERVELALEETVLTFCKGPGGNGPMVGACQQTGSPGPCQMKGT